MLELDYPQQNARLISKVVNEIENHVDYDPMICFLTLTYLEPPLEVFDKYFSNGT
jgi:hypothetical protein